MILGSKPVVVTYLATQAEPVGKTETVQVARLTIRQLYTYLEVLGGKDSPALVSLCTGKPLAWIDSLEDEAFGALIEECHAVNFQRAVSLTKRDPIAAVKFAAFARDAQALAALVQKVSGQSTPDSSPAPVSSESPAETGNAASISNPTASAS